jgi:hypothetical protein
MKRRLLLVAMLGWVAPVSAHQAQSVVRHHSSHCPFERAREAAAHPASARIAAQKPAPAVVVIQGTPGAVAALGIGRSPVLMP